MPCSSALEVIPQLTTSARQHYFGQIVPPISQYASDGGGGGGGVDGGGDVRGSGVGHVSTPGIAAPSSTRRMLATSRRPLSLGESHFLRTLPSVKPLK